MTPLEHIAKAQELVAKGEPMDVVIATKFAALAQAHAEIARALIDEARYEREWRKP